VTDSTGYEKIPPLVGMTKSPENIEYSENAHWTRHLAVWRTEHAERSANGLGCSQ